VAQREFLYGLDPHGAGGRLHTLRSELPLPRVSQRLPQTTKRQAVASLPLCYDLNRASYFPHSSAPFLMA